LRLLFIVTFFRPVANSFFTFSKKKAKIFWNGSQNKANIRRKNRVAVSSQNKNPAPSPTV